MPFHGTELLDGLIEHWLRKMDVKVALDIGAGAGWRGRQIRVAHPRAQVIGYETELDYVDKFDLRNIYTDLRTRDAMDLVDGDGCEHYDLVFLGDVIEHLRRSDGLDLLHYLVYRTRHILIAYPERYPQDAWQGHASEAHRSAWEVADFNIFAPLMMARHEFVQGTAICVLVHGFGYLATAEDRASFEQERAIYGW